MTTETASRGIPEWLEPLKNTWQTASKLNQIFMVQDGYFTPWFAAVKPRIRKVMLPSPRGPVTRYLVKHVWAASRAHGVTLLPTDAMTPIDSLNKLVVELRHKLYEAKNELRGARLAPPRRVVVDHTNESIDLLRLLAMATDARPAPGVYWLLDSLGGVAYVGQSKNVLARMSGHVGKEFATVRMVQISDDKRRLEIESRLIRLLAPPKNIAGIGFKRTPELVATA